MHVCLQSIAFVGEIAQLELMRLGLVVVDRIWTLSIWAISGGRKQGKRVPFMPCHFDYSVSSFRMFGHMLSYLISTLIANDAGVGFDF